MYDELKIQNECFFDTSMAVSDFKRESLNKSTLQSKKEYGYCLKGQTTPFIKNNYRNGVLNVGKEELKTAMSQKHLADC